MTKENYLSLFEENIRATNYTDVDYDELVCSLKSCNIGETESNALAAAVKYMIALRGYSKPHITKKAVQRIDRFWMTHTVDNMISFWGDKNISTLYRLCGCYSKEYIQYLLNENPDVVYEDYTHKAIGLDVKRVHMDKFAPILYEDYLELKRA